MKKLEMLKETMEINSIVSEVEINQIRETYNLPQLTKEELMELRKNIIIYCDDIKTEARMSGEWEIFDTYGNLESKVICVIEKEWFDRK